MNISMIEAIFIQLWFSDGSYLKIYPYSNPLFKEEKIFLPCQIFEKVRLNTEINDSCHNMLKSVYSTIAQ